MNQEESNAVVEEAIARSIGRDSVVPETSEFEELAKIHMASLSDWTIQLTYIVGDKRWDRADNALIAANMALQKLSGAISKLMEK